MQRVSGTIVCSLAAYTIAAAALRAQTPQNVLVVVNDASPVSRSIGEYYALRREVPSRNICHLHTSTDEIISRAQYGSEIAAPIANCLKKNDLVETILYIVTTLGVPLKIPGSDGLSGDAASVDTELTLLYSDMTRPPHSIAGSLPNPFFGRINDKFSHPQFPIYLVTRLAAYDFDEVKGIVDRSLRAVNRGKFVVDLAGDGNPQGEEWLLNSALLLPPDRVVLDKTSTALYFQKDVIAYASWGSNDPNHHRRFTGFEW